MEKLSSIVGDLCIEIIWLNMQELFVRKKFVYPFISSCRVICTTVMFSEIPSACIFLGFFLYVFENIPISEWFIILSWVVQLELGTLRLFLSVFLLSIFSSFITPF